MNRRGFLTRIGGAAVAVGSAGAIAAQASPATNPDDFTHNGYRVKWRDFQSVVDQNVVCGMWHAKHETKDLAWVSTSLGQCYPSRAWEKVDLTLQRGWPMLTIFSTAEERAAVKSRALDALRFVLDAPLTPTGVLQQVDPGVYRVNYGQRWSK